MLRAPFTACILCLSAVPASGFAEGPAASKETAKVGAPAPDVPLVDSEGRELRLSSLLRKKAAVIVFLPKNLSSASPSALGTLRDGHDALAKDGVEILAVCPDAVESIRRARRELKLPFPLLSDATGAAARSYGLPSADAGGKAKTGCAVFLVDAEGVVRRADPDVDTKSLGAPAGPLDAAHRLAKPAAAAAVKPAGPAPPRITDLAFGRVTIDGKEYTSDVVIDRGKVRERDKGPSKSERARFGHTPLTPKEEIPWSCKVLLIGIGMDGQLPVVEELKKEAAKRGVRLIILETPKAVEYLREHYDAEMNAILHITC